MTCCCSKDKRIIIVRGDDTDFNDGNLVEFRITSDILDVGDFKAKIVLNGITKNYNDLSSGVIEFNLASNETAQLPFGDINGTLYLISQSNKVATMTSVIPFKVISVVESPIETSDVDYNINVEQGGETIFNIEVHSAVSVRVGTIETLPAGSDAYVENVGTDNHLVLNFGIPQGIQGEQGEQGEQGPTGEDGADGKDAKINGVNTLTLNTTYGISLSQSGSTATLSGKEITDVIDGISALIPAQATEQNQLADKSFVNSSIATNTANFIGTFNSVADLEAYSGPLTNNDYAFVVGTDSSGNTIYDRYKYTTSTTPASWVFEYELNNSSFTANQWAAINSGATTTNIGQITTNETAIGDLSTLTTTANTDLVSAVNEVNSTAGSKVSDVKLNNVSVVSSGVANIPVAGNGSSGNLGVVKGNTSWGISVENSGYLRTVAASVAEIGGKTNQYKPLVPSSIDTVIKAGLTTNTLTFTDAEKQAARTLIGAGTSSLVLNAGNGLSSVDGVQYDITGSPTITNGVASGFSTANYLTTKGTLNSTLSKDGDSITFDFSVNYNSATSSSCHIYTIFVNSSNYLRIYQSAARLYVLARVSGANVLQMYTNQNVFTLNSKSYFRIKETRVSSTSYTFDILYSTDGTSYTNVGSSSLSSSVLLAFNGNKIDIGVFTGNASIAYPYVNGSIDLKDFKITNSAYPTPMTLNVNGGTLLNANMASSISSSSTNEELISAKLLYEEIQKVQPIDVKINGTSIVTSGVANIPIADLNGTYGLVKLYTYDYGLSVVSNGLTVLGSTNTQITTKSNTNRPLLPKNIDLVASVSARSIYDKVKAISSGTIELDEGCVFYTDSPSAATTYTISTTNLTQSGFNYRYFNVLITMPATAVDLDFTTNNNVVWTENETPDMSVGGRTYLLAFQTFDGGTNWVGSLCTWWENS